jgi:hypothetical protein
LWPSYPSIYGAIDSFRRLIITPILVLSAIPGLDRAIMAGEIYYYPPPPARPYPSAAFTTSFSPSRT